MFMDRILNAPVHWVSLFWVLLTMFAFLFFLYVMLNLACGPFEPVVPASGGVEGARVGPNTVQQSDLVEDP